MTKAVWKFPIEMKPEFALAMPADSQLLHVGTQNGAGFVWALVDIIAPKAQRYFRLLGTGHEHTEAGKYVGSFMLQDGAYVFHLFEVQP